MTTVDRSYHERRIKNAVGWFLTGCIAFVALEFFLIYLATLKFTHPELDLPGAFVILGLGGICLLWQMLVAMFFRTPLPDNYRPIDRSSDPEVFAIIEEITMRLNLPRPHGVYTAPGINAAVFCRPTMMSMFVRPKQELVIGENLAEILTSDELKVILYHEFGHYVSDSLGKKTPIYVISQFSKSFTAVKKLKKTGIWNNMVDSQVAVFSYFAFCLCAVIDRHYKPLAQGEELTADDVAVENMGAELLVRTLVKVSLLQHYCRYIRWVGHKTGLQLHGGDMSRFLLFLYHNHEGGVRSIPPAIRQRIERYMTVGSAMRTPAISPGVRQDPVRSWKCS